MKAAIFDMDGTLVDSMPYWRGHLMAYLDRLAVPIPEDLEVRINQAGSFRLLFKELQRKHPTITMEEIISDYHQMMRHEYEATIKPKPHVLDYLSYLQDRAIPMCIATATPRELFMPMMTRTGLADFFNFYITVPEIGVPKSSPDIYEYCADRFGLRAAQCAVFEDTIQAIRTSKAAGFYTIGVADETSAWAEKDIRSTCDRFIHSFMELLQ